MMAGVDEFIDRMRGKVLARLRSPKVRKGTRFWSDQVKSAPGTYETGGQGPLPHYERKAIDPDQVSPDSLTGEIVEAMRPVVFGVARDAAADATRRLGADAPDVLGPDRGDDDPAAGMFELDHELLDDLIDEALEDLLGGADAWAADVRRVVVDGDRDGTDLDTLLTEVGEALDQGGKWLRLRSRDLGTALAGKAAIEQARALGVTHLQWISRRDERVRPSHVIADGQVRELDDAFRVGRHQLHYPADPTGLPATAEEVYGCRCGLLFADRDDEFLAALDAIVESARHRGDPPGVAETLEAAASSAEYVPGPEIDGLPGIAALTGLPESVVGWRELDALIEAAPGQTLTLPAGTTLGMASPRQLSPRTLAVLLPEGTVAGIAGGTMTLGEEITVQVLAVGEGGVQARLLRAA